MAVDALFNININIYYFQTENISVGFTDTDWSPQLWGEAWNNVIWSYLGWEQICIVTGEVKNPQRNVPIIIGRISQITF